MSSSPGSSSESGPERPQVSGPALQAITSTSAHPERSAAAGRAESKEPRDAATVILLRPEAGGYSVYLVKRAQAIAFMGGAHVFPGGRVDRKTDATPAHAACREALEEASVRLDPDSLVPFARWVTPEVEPKRFDAHFFVAAVPADVRGEVDRGEITEAIWLTPRDALAAAERGEIALPPPTLWNLQDLAALPTIEAVLAEGRRRQAAGIAPVCPRILLSAAESGRVVLLLPGDPQFEDPAAAPGDEGAWRRFELVEGRWRVWR